MNDKIAQVWWSVSREEILQNLDVDPKKGLSDTQVQEFENQFGKNIFLKLKQRSVFDFILESMQEPMMLLLLSIAVLAFIFGKLGTAVAMIFEVFMYAILELINKFRADRTMTQLKALAHPTAKVLRNGSVVQINTNDIVVGDILILSQSVLVPADARLLMSNGLMVNQASLTGESLPVDKDAAATLNAATILSERSNAVFAGTLVMNGEGTALVMAVGSQSEFGKIAQQTQVYQEERTLLQTSMDQLAKILAIFAVVISIVIPVVGLIQGLDFSEMILTWLALTFLMIPCQPPIIITVALSLAAFLLAKKHVVAKRLFGIEKIGQVTAVVSDKTGTITESSMAFQSFYTTQGETKDLPQDISEKLILALPDYCHHIMDVAISSVLQNKKKNKTQIDFFGFSDKKPWRDLVYQDDLKFLHVITGNPEMLVKQSTLSVQEQEEILNFVNQKAQQGSKLSAYAYVYHEQKELDVLSNLTFLTVVVMKDPVRPGVKDALTTLSQAGIRTFIVTGDHTSTAQTIASEIGVLGEVISGEQFDAFDDQTLLTKFKNSNIFARMNPLQKLRLVNVLKQQEIVAVIGDGINDAPALKAANVGIAMGQIGTDLAKEVSELVLTDDNYIHLPDAIAISRNALDNFKKGLTFYLSAKVVLLGMFMVPLLFAIPFPLTPIHIILIELLMDLASSTIFVAEDVEPGIMDRPYEKVIDFLGKPLFFSTIKYGAALTVGILFLYINTYYQYDSVTAQTVALVAWLIGHILLAFNLRQQRLPIIKQGLFSNNFALFWIFFMIGLSIILTSVPTLYPYVKTTWLPWSLWAEIIIVVVITTFWIEIAKLIKFKK